MAFAVTNRSRPFQRRACKQPRKQRLLHQIYGRLLLTRVSHLGLVLHVRRIDSVGTADLNDLILASLKELARLIRRLHVLPVDALREDSRSMRTVAAPMHSFKLLTQPLSRLHRDRVVGLHEPRQPAGVAEVRTAVRLKGLGQGDGVTRERDRQHAHDAVV